MMEAFEKWADKQDRDPQSYKEEWARKCGWRAAMKNILQQMNENKFMDNGELRTYIEEELGRENEG